MTRTFTPEYAKQHNAKRREKYHSDPEYRQRALKRARVMDSPNLEYRNEMLERARIVSTFGKVRKITVEPKGNKRTMLVLTIDEIAEAFGRKKFVIKRWRDEDKFPDSNLVTIHEDSGDEVPVYLAEEIVAALIVMADHFSETPYYHPAHVETKSRLFAAMEKVRKQKRTI